MIDWYKTYQDFIQPLDEQINKDALYTTRAVLDNFPRTASNMNSMYQVALMTAGDIVIEKIENSRRRVKCVETNGIIDRLYDEAHKIAQADVTEKNFQMSDIRGAMIYWQSMERELYQN